MKPAPFDYVAPTNVAEALALRAEVGGGASVLAGGQTLTPLLALRMSQPFILVHINRTEGMRGVTRTPDATPVGAMTRQSDALDDREFAAAQPILVEALGHVGHQLTRNRGKIGGSIALGEPAAELPATAIALGAELEVHSMRGERRIAADGFHLGPYLIALDPEELPHGRASLSASCGMLNDMVTDAKGRAYVDAHFDVATENSGIVLVDPNGECRIVAQDMRSPNGLAITPNGKTLVANDLFANRILAFDIAEDGSLANRRVYAELGEYSPDGFCLDADGGAWIGLPFQGKFHRIREGGEITHEIDCGNNWGIAPVLGGPDRRTLFLATAKVTLEAMPRLIKNPRNVRKECRGRIEAVENAPAPGVGWP